MMEFDLDTQSKNLDAALDTNAIPKRNCSGINYCIKEQYSIEKPLLEQTLNTNPVALGYNYE